MAGGGEVVGLLENIPQTELAMRGSYGVAFRRGHEVSVAAVAPAGGRFLL